ncbi:hypothetical protein HBB16_00815 [Pseudonocardia sp. MCCB 268]|nr:hypothetical protein [Pseudonocardia cytotoxica]
MIGSGNGAHGVPVRALRDGPDGFRGWLQPVTRCAWSSNGSASCGNASCRVPPNR